MPLMPLFWSHLWARLPAVETQTKYALPIVHPKLPMVKSLGPVNLWNHIPHLPFM